MGSSALQRHEIILAEVHEKGSVTIKDLLGCLSVSEATVRRDLKALSADGRLELIYGGATRSRASDFSFKSKEARNIEAKRLIGRLAATLVGSGDQIFIDSGTSSLQLARHLSARRGLSIIANSCCIATELNGQSHEIILLGGRYRPEKMDMVGPLAISSLEQLRGYVAFVGADGLSQDFGLAASDIDSADLNGRAIANARATVLLADHSKFLSPALYRIVDFAAISQVVTDRPPAQDWLGFFADKGIDVMWPEAKA